MLNSGVNSRLPQKMKDAPADASEAANAAVGSLLRAPPKKIVKGLLRTFSRNSSPAPAKRSSSTSMVPSRADPDAANLTQRLKNKFTQPRMNQLTHQRINRVRCTNTAGEVESGRVMPLKKLAKNASQQSLISSAATYELQMDDLRRKLTNLQSEFIRKMSSCKQKDYSFKFITIIHNDDCSLLVHNDDMHSLPRHIPVQTVNDLKNRCRVIFESSAKRMHEQMAVIQMAQDETVAKTFRDEFRLQMDTELNSELEAIYKQIDQLCSSADKSETGILLNQIKDLNASKEEMACTITKLTSELVGIQKSKDDISKDLEVTHKQNLAVAEELANKHTLYVEQNQRIIDLKDEVEQSVITMNGLQQDIFEKDETIAQLKCSIETKDKLTVDRITQLQQIKADKDFLKHRSEELSETLAERELFIGKQQQLIKELEQYKELQRLQEKRITHNEADLEKLRALQIELENQNLQLESQTKVEQQLRTEVEAKQELLRQAEQRLCRLEEQEEHNRQMLTVRGDRIKHLDQEMKQRELECKRKVNEVMCTASAKNTAITQMTNQLAAKNEQFDNLCATLSTKQSKLHSQEHVIKLLEESNTRSHKLHTKLGERNANLKEELEHLRRTVRIYVKILIGNNGQNVFEPVPASEVLRLLTKSKE